MYNESHSEGPESLAKVAVGHLEGYESQPELHGLESQLEGFENHQEGSEVK